MAPITFGLIDRSPSQSAPTASPSSVEYVPVVVSSTAVLSSDILSSEPTQRIPLV